MRRHGGLHGPRLVRAAIALSMAACAIGPDATAIAEPGAVSAGPAHRVRRRQRGTAIATTGIAERRRASPAAAVPLTVEWNAGDLKGIGTVDVIRGVVKAGDTYVLLASLPYEDGAPDSAVWWSSDGTSWTLAKTFPVADRIFALTAGGPGFVVAGINDDDAAVWTSTDGRAWQSVSDPSLDKATISQLITTDSGLIGFGWRSDNEAPGIWTSADGAEWLAATNETGMTVAKGLEAVGSDGGRAIAFVSEGDKKPPAIWETTGRAEWTRTGALQDVAAIDRVAGGTRGWVALGDNRAWTSADGQTWGKGVPGPDVDQDVIVDDAGYVAVGYVGSLPGETCGDQRPFAGHTWTSADGKTWERMPVTKAFESAMVTNLLVVDRTLLGYGQRIEGDGVGQRSPGRGVVGHAPGPHDARRRVGQGERAQDLRRLIDSRSGRGCLRFGEPRAGRQLEPSAGLPDRRRGLPDGRKPGRV